MIEKYSKIFIILSLVLGMIFGVGLLTYSGKELVNVMVFLSLAVFIPLLFSLISFGSLIYNFFKKDILIWQGLKFSNQIGFLFSFGLFLSFLLTIATKDIAFGWSTTLNIDAKEIYNFLGYFAFWKDVLPTAFVDVNLIELSHFQRLGNTITNEQISNAHTLGSWWKFLTMMVLVWGVFIRFFLYQFSRFGLKLFEKNRSLHYEASTAEEEFIPLSDEYNNKIKSSLLKDKSYQILSWSVDKQETIKLLQSYSIKSSSINFFAQSSDIDDDINAIKLLQDIESIIIVKAWEAPTMEFIDFLDELDIKQKIYLLGIGDEKELNIWLRKLKETSHDNIISIN